MSTVTVVGVWRLRDHRDRRSRSVGRSVSFDDASTLESSHVGVLFIRVPTTIRTPATMARTTGRTSV